MLSEVRGNNIHAVCVGVLWFALMMVHLHVTVQALLALLLLGVRVLLTLLMLLGVLVQALKTRQQKRVRKLTMEMAREVLQPYLRHEPTDATVKSAIEHAWLSYTGQHNAGRVHALVETLKGSGIPAMYSTMNFRQMRTILVELARGRHKRANKKKAAGLRTVFNEEQARAAAEKYVSLSLQRIWSFRWELWLI